MIKNSRGKYPAAVYCLSFNKYGSGRDRVQEWVYPGAREGNVFSEE